MVRGTPSSHGGEGSIPSCHGMGVPQGTPTRPWMGYPHQDLAWGTPIQTWDGVPPTQTWDWVPLPSRPGIGYPLSRPGMGYPPLMVNRQTFPSINITFTLTMYVGGKKYIRKTYCFITDGRGFKCRPEPPSMLVDTFVSTWIKKAWLPC